MKSLQVIPGLSPATGGPVTVVLGRAGSQSKLGHNVTIVATNYGIGEVLSVEGENLCISFPMLSLVLVEGLSERIAWSAKDADIVHVHMGTFHMGWRYTLPQTREALYPQTLWNALQVVFITRVHRKRSYTCAFLYVLFLTMQRPFITHRKEKGQTLCPLLIRIRDLLFQLACLYRRMKLFRHQKPFPSVKGHRIVLFLGRLHYKKQPEVVIRAFQRVYASDPVIHLVVTGPGDKDYVKKLEQLVTTMNMDGKVTFTGMLHSEAVREAYRAAQLFVLPSLLENFGISVTEAMASGLPVLVSNRCGCYPDIIQEGINGFSFDLFNESQLMQLMMDIIQGKYDLKAMGRASFDIIKVYPPEKVAEMYLNAIHFVVTERGK